MENTKELRKYTHKENEDEIVIKRISRISDIHFQSEFLLMKEHHFYSDFQLCNKPMNLIYLLECARQAETVLSHKEFNIAQENRFLLSSWMVSSYSTKKEVKDNINADIYTKNSSNEKVKWNEFHFIFKGNNITIGEAKINVRYIDDRCYKLIRKKPVTINNKQEATPLDPRIVCYKSADNVILAKINFARSYASAIIHINKRNKFFNDHEQDHITGMNLTEAAKQLCYSYLSKIIDEEKKYFSPVLIDGNFISYVENDIPAIVSITKIHSEERSYSFCVDVIQNDKTLAKINLKMRGTYG